MPVARCRETQRIRVIVDPNVARIPGVDEAVEKPALFIKETDGESAFVPFTPMEKL